MDPNGNDNTNANLNTPNQDGAQNLGGAAGLGDIVSFDSGAAPTDPSAPAVASDLAATGLMDTSTPDQSAQVAEPDATANQALATPEPPIQAAPPTPGSIGSSSGAPATATASPSPVNPFANRNSVNSEPPQSFTVQDSTQPAISTAPQSSAAPTANSDTNLDHQALQDLADATPMPSPLDQPKIPKRKESKATIILLVVVLTLLIAGIVAYFVFTNQNGNLSSTNTESSQTSNTSNDSSSNNSGTSSGNSTNLTSLSCSSLSTLDPDTEALSAQEKFTIDFTNGELSAISETLTWNYPSIETARTQLAVHQDVYRAAWAALGLTSDPFVSQFAISETVVTETITAPVSAITAENAPLLNLGLDESGKLVLDQADIKAHIEALGDGSFTCTAVSGNVIEISTTN